MRILCAVTLLSVLAATAHAAAVVVVNGNSSVLQAAIDSAADGDILLVAPDGGLPEFETVTVDGKGLTLVVDGGGYAVRQLVLRNIPVGSQMTVRGLQLGGGFVAPFGGDAATVEVRDCAGAVWIDSCTITAVTVLGVSGSSPPGANGVSVVSSADVVLTDCSITGGHGANEFGWCTIPGPVPASAGGEAVLVRDGRVAIHGSTLEGGEGGSYAGGSCPLGTKGAGGDGLLLAGASSAHVAGSTVGGADNPGNALTPGSGLVIDGTAATATLRGTSVTAGSGLPAQPDIVAPAGAVSSFPASPSGLQVSSPLRQGQPGQIEIQGEAGDLVALFESSTGDFLLLPGKQGVFLLGTPLVGPVFGAVNPTGAWSIPFGTPTVLPAGTDGATVLLQLLVKSGAQVLVEDVASCTVLDASF